MKPEVGSIRTFIGSKDFDISRSFYRDLGFEETELRDNLSLFRIGEQCFYLQKYYVQDWVGNTMLLFTLPDVSHCYQHINQLALDKKYPGVKVIPIQDEDWARVFRVIDPAGVLLHFAQFI